MALRSLALSDRLNRLERRVVRFPVKPMTKEQCDALVRRFIAEGDFSTLLSAETEDHRRAVIEAALRADH